MGFENRENRENVENHRGYNAGRRALVELTVRLPEADLTPQVLPGGTGSVFKQRKKRDSGGDRRLV